MNHQLVPSQPPPPSGRSDRWEYPAQIRPESQQQDGTPVDIRRFLTILRRRWWLLAIGAIVTSGAAWYQVRQQPRVYSAKAAVQLVDSRSALAGGLLSDADRLPLTYSMLTQVEIVRSRVVATAVVDSEPLGLRVFATGFSNSLLAGVALDKSVNVRTIPLTFTTAGVVPGASREEVVPYGQPITSGGVRFTVVSRPPEVTQGSITVRSHDLAVDRILSGLNVTPRERTNIIDIRFIASDPSTAQRVVNRAAQAYQAVNTRMAQQQLHRRRVFIEDQLARTDAQLAEADRALSTFRNQQNAYSSQEKFRAQQSAVVQLDLRREDLEGNRKMARTLLRRFETSNDAGRKTALSMLATAPELGDGRSSVPDLYRRLGDYQRSRAELISGPAGKATTHPDVQRLDTLIVSTQSDIVSATQAYITLLDARIEALDEVRTRDASTLQQIPFAEVAETRMQQNAEALRTQGVALRMEHQQARIAEAAEAGQVEIIDLATRAWIVQSGGPRFIMFAALMGLLAGGALAMLLESADRTVKRRDDLEYSLHVPVLGTIPRIESNGDRHGPLHALSAITSRRATGVSRRRKVALTAVIHSRSPGAEAFRHLGTSLFHSRAGQTARRILVTSPAAGDGKTSVASNLAITLAHQRHRVLLVDCDVYGKLHTIFQLPASPGISDVVLNGVHPTDVIHATGVAGLSLMTSGKRTEHGTDLIGSQRMRAMLNDMTHEFDLVVMDCSPILALADSSILSVDSDAVLLVVRAGYTASAAAVEAMRQLSTVGARVAGVVLNDPEDRARQYGSYYATYSYAGGR